MYIVNCNILLAEIISESEISIELCGIYKSD